MENQEKTTQSVRETIKDVMTEVEKHNNVKAIFGDPIREKNVVIIPVGSVSSRGGGGGGGAKNEDSGEGSDKVSNFKFPKGKGSGMGVGYARQVRPIGYIEIKEDKAVFKPIVDAGKIAAFAIGAGMLGVCMVARAVLKKTRKHDRIDG